MITFFSDEKAIYGGLKSASNGDLDVLYSVKKNLETQSTIVNYFSFLPIVVGIMMCFTIFLIPVGAIFIGLAVFARSKNAKFKKNIPLAYARYEQELLAEKEQLLSQEVILVEELNKSSEILEMIGLSQTRIDNVLKEVSELCLKTK